MRGGSHEADHCGGDCCLGASFTHLRKKANTRDFRILSAPANNFWGSPHCIQQRQHHSHSRMAASEPSRYLARSLPRAALPSVRSQSVCWRRNASDDAASKSSSSPSSDQFSELESGTTFAAPLSEDVVKSFDPVARAKSRMTQLPKSRYVFGQFRHPTQSTQPVAKSSEIVLT